jgi:lycopene cyclase domain-containing protein
MTYLLLCAGFVAAAVVIALSARRRGRMPSWASLAIAAASLLVLTAVFDSIMIWIGLIDYSDAHISGIRIGLAPIEDFTYPLVAVILLPALWSRLRRDRRHERGPR